MDRRTQRNEARELRAESLTMRFFRRLGLDSIAWSLRRLHCPVGPEALVLEVGSGGNPYARANVLLDAYEVTRERHWVPLKADRPTVLGFAESLPFRDKVFDFVIASHVVEHSSDPDRFLSELQRVAKAGYIETPDAFMERINPYKDHRLEVTQRAGRVVIRKKRTWKSEPDIVDLYEDRAKPVITQHTMRKFPFAFHMRHYWRERIDFMVVNPETDAGWLAPEEAGRIAVARMPAARIKRILGDLLRWLGSQRRRNRHIDLLALLRCPTCCSTSLSSDGRELACGHCGQRYEMRGGIPALYPATRNGQNARGMSA